MSSGTQAVSQFPVAGTIGGTELVPVVQNGVTVRTTTQALAAFAQGTPVAALNFIDPIHRNINQISLSVSPATLNGLLVYNGISALVNTGAGVSGQVLVGVTGGAPIWSTTIPASAGVSSFSGGSTGLTPSSSSVGAVTLSGLLTASSGGTGFSSYTVGDILYAGGAGTLSRLAAAVSGNVLLSEGTGVAPQYGKVNLSQHVTGVLSAASGGTSVNNGSNAITLTAPIIATGTNNQIYIGNNAGAGSLSANTADTIAIGLNALAVNSTSDITTALGTHAAETLTDGRASVFVGWGAGRYVATGNSNTYVGAFAGQGGNATVGQFTPVPSGSDNVAVGEAALICMHGASSNNVGVGYNSLYGLQVGSNNTGIGINAGLNSLFTNNGALLGTEAYWWGYGSNSTVVGAGAAEGTWTATVSVGTSAGGQKVVTVADTSGLVSGQMFWTGLNNPDNSGGSGPAAPYFITAVSASTVTLNFNLDRSITNNTPIFAITNPHTGSGLTAIGQGACQNIQGTTTPTAVGYHSLNSITTGANNTSIGFNSFFALTSAGNATSLGFNAGYQANGNNNTAIGSQALGGVSVNPVLTGTNNTAVGAFAFQALQGAATNNTAVGTNAAVLKTSGSNDTVLGALAMASAVSTANNVVIGEGAGAALTTGTGNIIIGFGANAVSAAAVNTLNIGSAIYGTGISGLTPKIGMGNGNSSPNSVLDLNGPLTLQSTTAVVTASVAGSWIIWVDGNDSNKLKARASTGNTVTLGTP